LIGVTNPTTRFDHSVGVMLLIRKLGAGSSPASALLKEQVAALLHDVSHTAFSHVIDYVSVTMMGRVIMSSRRKRTSPGAIYRRC